MILSKGDDILDAISEALEQTMNHFLDVDYYRQFAPWLFTGTITNTDRYFSDFRITAPSNYSSDELKTLAWLAMFHKKRIAYNPKHFDYYLHALNRLSYSSSAITHRAWHKQSCPSQANSITFEEYLLLDPQLQCNYVHTGHISVNSNYEDILKSDIYNQVGMWEFKAFHPSYTEVKVDTNMACDRTVNNVEILYTMNRFYDVNNLIHSETNADQTYSIVNDGSFGYGARGGVIYPFTPLSTAKIPNMIKVFERQTYEIPMKLNVKATLVSGNEDNPSEGKYYYVGKLNEKWNIWDNTLEKIAFRNEYHLITGAGTVVAETIANYAINEHSMSADTRLTHNSLLGVGLKIPNSRSFRESAINFRVIKGEALLISEGERGIKSRVAQHGRGQGGGYMDYNPQVTNTNTQIKEYLSRSYVYNADLNDMKLTYDDLKAHNYTVKESVTPQSGVRVAKFLAIHQTDVNGAFVQVQTQWLIIKPDSIVELDLGLFRSHASMTLRPTFDSDALSYPDTIPFKKDGTGHDLVSYQQTLGNFNKDEFINHYFNQKYSKNKEGLLDITKPLCGKHLIRQHTYNSNIWTISSQPHLTARSVSFSFNPTSANSITENYLELGVPITMKLYLYRLDEIDYEKTLAVPFLLEITHNGNEIYEDNQQSVGHVELVITLTSYDDTLSIDLDTASIGIDFAKSYFIANKVNYLASSTYTIPYHRTLIYTEVVRVLGATQWEHRGVIRDQADQISYYSNGYPVPPTYFSIGHLRIDVSPIALLTRPNETIEWYGRVLYDEGELYTDISIDRDYVKCVAIYGNNFPIPPSGLYNIINNNATNIIDGSDNIINTKG